MTVCDPISVGARRDHMPIPVISAYARIPTRTPIRILKHPRSLHAPHDAPHDPRDPSPPRHARAICTR